ncbi:AraC family transcriptional regulator [Nocardioides sp. AX2bis]|uniref:AraC family transcriptional regulator n=1 Tax=Nocardioides sp. AX2bis TaxID=2653157 RepID=UPI0012EF5736|nr:AraC family transcriptional regulator [Nocardioides sp. AX2bis]VXB16113.1 AraC-like DNA-binding protein [Nocardioides sp. AX2bis]
MDVLEALLDGPRARRAFLLRALLDPPWSLRIEDEAPLCVLAALRGDAWLCPDGEQPVRLPEGHVAVVRGPEHYTLADRPDTAPDVVIHPGGRCTSVEDGRGLGDEWSLGIRTWGRDAAGECVLLVGTYEGEGEASRPLLSALPRVVLLDPDDAGSGLLRVLVTEMQVEAPGQRALLDRLLDVVLISALRTWFTGREAQAPGWFRAQDDPAVGAALALLHQQVAHPWTVAELAHRVGVSRAALGRRFTALLGEPPMAYLTGWRLALAADLLCASDATVASIAGQVGYGTPFSLSAAFKRHYGLSPQQYRSGRASA